ncbi:GNAT superfamily N-acetyltransferase [Agrobacterium larrymoorei]|uniref:GNAT superfamily N-acetyltransferase n=1 Tax=Agrobacterium larrymoorei TaxID=160699 RepID=A0AAJ2B5X4_9HYPH|nr:GNAT family N-acetyltransferase [Agrobacterium larrymoorei]MDR6099929.1 GNAT superfamily N-acetyltransferase [Agrobacterium larrymoorei]
MSDSFLYTSILDPLAKPLLDELLFEYESRYGTFFSAAGAKEEMNKYPPEAFSPPYGNFLLLLRNGQAIGGGAFMRYDDDTAEFKRVWTHSAYRRQGLAKKVLIELERQAVRQGYSRIYLTTGFRQPEAVGLYLSNGYSALFDRQADPQTIRSLPFEKWLSVATSAAIESASAASNPSHQFSVSR